MLYRDRLPYKEGHPLVTQNTHAFPYNEVLGAWHAMCESGWRCVKCLKQCVKIEQSLVTHWCLTLNVWEWMCVCMITAMQIINFSTYHGSEYRNKSSKFTIFTHTQSYTLHVYCILYVYIGICITCAWLCEHYIIFLIVYPTIFTILFC